MHYFHNSTKNHNNSLLCFGYGWICYDWISIWWWAYVCPWCNGYSFCLDLKPMNDGWIGLACISVKKLQWVSVLIFLMFFFPFALIFVIALLLVLVVVVVTSWAILGVFFFFNVNWKFYCLVMSYPKNPYDIFLFLS